MRQAVVLGWLAACSPTTSAAPAEVTIEPEAGASDATTREPVGAKKKRPPRPSHPVLGQPVPSVAGAMHVVGTGPRSVDDAAGKIVVLHFVATWNEPASKQMFHYQKLVADDVVVIAVFVDDPEDYEAEDIVDFAQTRQASYTMLWDRDRVVTERYQPEAMPTSYLIDPSGNLRAIHHGFRHDLIEILTGQIAELRAESP